MLQCQMPSVTGDPRATTSLGLWFRKTKDRFLFYNSNVIFRIIEFLASMPEIRPVVHTSWRDLHLLFYMKHVRKHHTDYLQSVNAPLTTEAVTVFWTSSYWTQRLVYSLVRLYRPTLVTNYSNSDYITCKLNQFEVTFVVVYTCKWRVENTHHNATRVHCTATHTDSRVM